MKSALIVPTDFSNNAWVATLYAANLAKKFDWDIHLLHTYYAFNSSFSNQQFNEEIRQYATEKAEASMQALLEKVTAAFPEIHVTSACIHGFLGRILPPLAAEGDNKFVVMGTKGASGLKHVVLGSNTYEVIQKSPIGVLAVPETYTGFKLEKVGLLSNFKDSEVELINAFKTRINTPLDLVLLHVSEQGRVVKDEDISFWKNHIQQQTGIEKIGYTTDTAVKRLDIHESIPYCIQQMVEKESIDLILVSYNRKSFFRDLFSKSLVKTIAHNLQVPTFFHRQV